MLAAVVAGQSALVIAGAAALMFVTLLLAKWFWYFVLGGLHHVQHCRLVPEYDDVVAAAIVAAYCVLALLDTYERFGEWFATRQRSQK